MEIILVKEVKGLGKAGDKKIIADGYAANYLLPQGLAIKAGSKQAQAFQIKLASQKSRQNKEIEQLVGDLPKISNLILEFKAKASASGTLFSGIGAKEIVQALTERLNFPVKEKMIGLDHDLKSLGEFSVSLKANNQILPFKIKITKEDV